MIIFLNRLRGIFLGFLIWVFYRTLAASWTIQIDEPATMKQALAAKIPLILAHFHGDELVFVSLIPRYKIATITSSSKDGSLVTTVVHLQGGKTSRGSSTRGGVTALKGLIKFCKNGFNTSFAVDGPKGPIYEVKPGIFELSRVMKSEIYCGGVFCDRAWHFPRAWNKTYLPKPFARIKIVWVGPDGPVKRNDDPRSLELAKALQNQLFAARQRAGKVIGSNAVEL